MTVAHPGPPFRTLSIEQILTAKPGKSVTTIFGMLAMPATRRRSIEELNEAAAAGWAGEV